VSASATICVEIPKISVPTVSLPMGIELQAIADLSKGPPTNCALLQNLMLQLMPTLAGLTCIFKILGVIAALEKFMQNPLDPSGATGVLTAIGDMGECITSILPATALFEMIKSILLLVIGYLKCFVEAIRSVLDFQVGIDLNGAAGNPALMQSLQCASDNAATTMQQMMMALAPIQPLFKMMEPVIKLSQLPIKLPSIADITGAKDVAEAVDKLDAMLTEMQQIVASIP
jgi:hypothetical protein